MESLWLSVVIIGIGMVKSQYSPDFKEADNSSHETIVGGSEIKEGSRPYLVALGDGESALNQYCGGSLITPNAVLTAAHCLFVGSSKNPRWLPPEWVEFNRHNLNDTDTDVIRMYLEDTSECTGDAVYHPEYDQNTIDNDVAILFLPEPITDIKPVILNTDPKVPSDDAPLDVSGWGQTDDGTLALSPNAVTVHYITNEACTRKPYRFKDNEITENMLCAGSKDKDSCYGDSGGPLVLAKKRRNGGPKNPVTQIGIVSWGGKYCADRSFPGVYTRISAVADFITNTVCERTGELCNISSKSGKSQDGKSGKTEDGSKSGKGSKGKSSKARGRDPSSRVSDSCVADRTYTPTTAIFPTYSPTMPWPTWMPTLDEDDSKSGKSSRKTLFE